jgi:endoglucanase
MSAAPPAEPALAAHARLARTVNMSQDLGAPLERGWGIDIQQRHLADCAENGFTAIRLPVCLAAHRTGGRLDPKMLRRIEQVTDQARSLGLAVAVSNHRDPELMASPQAHLGDLLATVSQLARALKGRGSDVVLEPLTEPCHALDPRWNTVAAELIGAVRTEDPDITLLLGPRSYSNARFLGELSLPAQERNLIIGVHHYWPITFTMQGEMFLGEDHPFGNPRSWLGTTWDQTPEQEAELCGGFSQMAGWGTMTGRPLFLGEFGTTSNADMASRVRWTRFNRKLAEQHGMSWGIWSFAPTFAIYDLDTGAFNTELLAALKD